ncbi:MAG: hypothetical protein WA978_15715, partial [Sphingopyxis granuli]|uniref:hypothetical protein n=1 Tax=Sphingopyxis granuli TaxID=267128 RepID=UPI003C7635DC
MAGSNCAPGVDLSPANGLSSSVMLNLFQHPWPGLSFKAALIRGQAMAPETSWQLSLFDKSLFPGESRGPDGTALPR